MDLSSLAGGGGGGGSVGSGHAGGGGSVGSGHAGEGGRLGGRLQTVLREAISDPFPKGQFMHESASRIGGTSGLYRRRPYRTLESGRVSPQTWQLEGFDKNAQTCPRYDKLRILRLSVEQLARPPGASARRL